MKTPSFTSRAAASRLVGALCLLGLCAARGAGSAAGATGGEPGEFDFQSFVNDPPVIKEMVFSSEKPPLAAGGTNRQPTQFFLLRWESPFRFVLRVASSLDELAQTGDEVASAEWFCASEVRWWHLVKSPTNQFLVRLWDTATPSDKRRNPVLITVNTIRQVNVDHVVKLGLWHLPRSGVVWQGDHFAFTNETEQTTGMGQVLREPSGRVTTVLFTFTRPIMVQGKSEMGTWRHRNDYTYDDEGTLPAGFPAQIDNYVLRESAPPFHNERLRFHHVVLSSDPLAPSELDFEPIVGRHALTRWVTINDIEHVFDGKRWSPVPDLSMFDRNRRVPRWLLLFVVAALLAPTILLAVRSRRNENAA